MQEYVIRDDFIKLGQAMKAANLVNSGVEAKIAIQNGEVQVNGSVEIQRGKKLHDGDIFTFQNKSVKIISGDL